LWLIRKLRLQKNISPPAIRRELFSLSKKKKYQEILLERTDAQLMNLEELTNSIEYALVEKQVLDGLKAGNDVLKEIQREMSLEAVEQLMDETAEAIAYQNEISEMLGSKITAEDEEEIEKELLLLSAPQIVDLPPVPTYPIPAGKTTAEAEKKARPVKRREEEDAMLAA